MVQVLGIDMWNGSAFEVYTFKQSTGATYPLLLNGETATGGNLATLYGPYDNYVVIDMRDTTVVYHAALLWPHGERYHLGEIRAAVDGILATVDAPGPGLAEGPSLRVAPNPVRDRLRVEFVIPGGGAAGARLTLYDAAGRACGTLPARSSASGEGGWEGPLRSLLGAAPRAGVYFLRLDHPGESLVQRFVVLPE